MFDIERQKEISVVVKKCLGEPRLGLNYKGQRNPGIP
jgi:hypothetical protein